ncbi:MAG: Ig-like domain-containing protein [Gammaproteobacteria bacterium]|nr:Ig-like domain-containing protein [Gammaproteobacteria bacterium]
MKRTLMIGFLGMLSLAATGLLSACGGGGDNPPPEPVPSLTRSTLAISPATALTANGAAVAHITVQLRDSSGAKITNPDAVVALYADFGDLDYTGSNGQVNGTLTSTQAGDDTVSFSIDGATSPNTGTVTFVAGPADPAASSIVLSAPGAATGTTPVGIADAVTPLIATVTLRDQYGNPLLHGGDEVRIFASLGAVGRVTDHDNGTYSAEITSIAAGNGSATFSLGGTGSAALARARTAAPAAASGAPVMFVPPPASAASVYRAAWTIRSCNAGGCLYSGIYTIDTTNPGASPTQVASGDLMMPGYPSAPSFGSVYRAYYDPSTDRVLQLGPATVIYAKGGALRRLDLIQPSATPQTLSTLSLTALCGLYLTGPYGISFGNSPAGEPAWALVLGFDSPGATPADCLSGTPQVWLIPTDGDASTVPISGDFAALSSAKALVDPATGQVQGLVVVDDTGDLVFYSADLSVQTVLQAGFVPPGSSVQLLNPRGIHDTLIFDVSSISGGTRTDDLFRVTASGVSPVTTLSFSTSNPYFDSAHCGALYDAAHFFLASFQGPGGELYFQYPTSGGAFAVYALAPGGTTPAAIYNEPSGHCLYGGFSHSASGRLLFAESATPIDAFPNAFRAISIATAGPPAQAPVVLASDPASIGMSIPYYSVTGQNAWILDLYCDNPSCSTYSAQIIVARPNGTLQQTFTDSVIGGDAQQGSVASSGATLRKYIAIAPDRNSACTSTGWVLYDPATMVPVLSPNFGAGKCSRGVFLYGPNDSFLFGSVPDAGATQAWAYALFGIGGTSAIFGPYGPSPGYFEPQVIPMY